MVQKTFNPIISEKEYQSGFFPQIPIPGTQQAIVLVARGDGHRMRVISDNRPISSSEIRRGHYDYQILVDMHPRKIDIILEAYTMDQSSMFRISIGGTASVIEPDTVCREHITDAAECFENEIESKVQYLAANYLLEEADHLREKIESEVSASDFGDDGYIVMGIIVSKATVVVRGDEEYEKLMKDRRKFQNLQALDRAKIHAAEQARMLYPDMETALYGEYAAGKMSSVEMMKKIQEEKDARFKQSIQQGNAMIDLVEKAKNADISDKMMPCVLHGDPDLLAQNMIAEQNGGSGQKRISFESFDEDEDE